MPGKETKGKAKSGSSRFRGALDEDLDADKFAAWKDGRKSRHGEDEGADADDNKGFLLPGDTTQKILKAARRQIEREDDNNDDAAADDDNDGDDARNDRGDDTALEEVMGEEPKGYIDGEYDGRLIERDDDDDDNDVDLEYDDQESVATDAESFVDMEEALNIDAEEARLLEKFQPQTNMQTRNLADIIAAKIKEQEADGKAGDRAPGATAAPVVDKRVARVYAAIGHVLRHFTSGKIPKAFKVLPYIQNWEELLMLTNPHDWSPIATYKATRIFAANLNERMAQRFYSSILLPIIMERLTEEKKLHPGLFMALRKALFKPVAFYKGFLLPLVEDTDCTLRMALVVASVLQKMHLPPLPTAVVLFAMARMPFKGSNCVILRVLIDKKMKLPFQAVDALVAHFHRFTRTHNHDDLLPVLWHQTFLSFVQRYKENFTAEQIRLLKEVCDKHFHRLITPDTRRELTITEKKLASA